MCLRRLWREIFSCSFLNAQNAKKQSDEIFFADPTIFHEKGKFYLTGTRGRAPLGFSVLESTNLTEWKTPTNSSSANKMLLAPGNKVFGDKGFWAPQILKEKKLYYLTYTANEQVAIANSSSLTGEYFQETPKPVDASEKNIDSYIFKDNDGKYYLYHVRFNRGNFIWVAEFDFKAGKIKHGDRFQDYVVISVTQEELVIGCHKFRMSYLMDFGSKNLQK